MNLNTDNTTTEIIRENISETPKDKQQFIDNEKSLILGSKRETGESKSEFILRLNSLNDILRAKAGV